MTPELQYFLDHIWGIVPTAIVTFVAWRQGLNKKTIVVEIRESLREDLKNGVGERIALKAVEHMSPVLAKVATVAADRIVQSAISTASDLAAKNSADWNGVERRSGVGDRRTGLKDRREG